MTPQSSFMIVAPLVAGQLQPLRDLLATMNSLPGTADPANALIPFGRFERLHVARIFVLEELAPDDMHDAYGVPGSVWPPSLAFLGDCDGPAEQLLAEFVAQAEAGLREIFSFCQGFGAGTDLMAWMRAHETPPAALYANWQGRTVRQIREEDALRNALVDYLADNRESVVDAQPDAVRVRLLTFFDEQRRQGNLTLTQPEPTPPDWQSDNLLH